MAASMKKMVHVDYPSSDSGSDGDLESSNDSREEGESIDEEEDGSTDRHSGLANVMAKILQKKVPIHKQVILTKGQKRKVESTEDGNEEKKHLPAEGSLPQHEKVKVWENMNRVKPDPLERNRERQFQRIATRGVVQLFNAVRKQQALVKEEVEQVGTSTRKRDKVMEGMTKDKFMTILKGTTASNVKVEKPEKIATKLKTEPVDDGDEEKWSILRDDYMMGARMKDWNKDSSGDEEQPPDMSDSD